VSTAASTGRYALWISYFGNLKTKKDAELISSRCFANEACHLSAKPPAARALLHLPTGAWW
jgi:hypothetical protein